MKAYKGFHKDMTCKDFQYEEGKSYHEDKAVCCETGFHACEYPLDCLSYYEPNDSVYHKVDCLEIRIKTQKIPKYVLQTLQLGLDFPSLDLFRLLLILPEKSKKRSKLQ